MQHSIEYLIYLSSPEWKSKRHEALRRADYHCQRCPQWGQPLDVHHKSYERLGCELPSDLEVLCRPCHKIADSQRAQATQERVYHARLNGWATKKYGNDWDTWQDPDMVEEEFESWLEHKGELRVH